MKQQRPATVTMHRVAYGADGRRLSKIAGPSSEQQFLDAIPEDVYEPCPCGCGQKWKFVKQGGETAVRRHMIDFSAKRLGLPPPQQ